MHSIHYIILHSSNKTNMHYYTTEGFMMQLHIIGESL